MTAKLLDGYHLTPIRRIPLGSGDVFTDYQANSFFPFGVYTEAASPTVSERQNWPWLSDDPAFACSAYWNAKTWNITGNISSTGGSETFNRTVTLGQQLSVDVSGTESTTGTVTDPESLYSPTVTNRCGISIAFETGDWETADGSYGSINFSMFTAASVQRPVIRSAGKWGLAFSAVMTVNVHKDGELESTNTMRLQRSGGDTGVFTIFNGQELEHTTTGSDISGIMTITPTSFWTESDR